MHCPDLSHLTQCDPSIKGWPWSVGSTPPLCTTELGRDWPHISVVIPSFNQGRFLEKAIRSVLLQSYPNLDLVLMDGGSTDESLNIIEKYREYFSFWTSQGDDGQAAAINQGFSHAKGPIFAWLNSDDYFLPNAFFHVGLQYNQHPEAGGWFGSGVDYSVTGKMRGVRTPKDLSHQGLGNLRQNWVRQPACFFSAAAFVELGGLNESLHFALDSEFWIRLAESYEIVKIDQEIAAATIHADAKTRARRGAMLAEAWKVQIEKGFYQNMKEDVIALYEKQQEIEHRYMRVKKLLRLDSLPGPLRTILSRLARV